MTHILHRQLRGTLPFAVEGRGITVVDHVLLAPPFICTQAEIDEIVHRLGAAVDAAL
ncbi:MAG: hypothetical protein ACREU5_02850 [Burkholderiales bacterium]